MTAIAETGRLRLREFRLDDLDDLAAMVADAEQMRFYGATRSRDEAAAWLERTVAGYREQRFAPWLVETRDDGRFAGYCGIRELELDGVRDVEIGWHIRKPLWGRGLATEAAEAALDLAFGRFELTRLVAVIPVGHAASIAVATRLGMRPERESTYEGMPVVVYAVERG
jgi:RimJ/RimL family protein N-acetyltransferase